MKPCGCLRWRDTCTYSNGWGNHCGKYSDGPVYLNAFVSREGVQPCQLIEHHDYLREWLPVKDVSLYPEYPDYTFRDGWKFARFGSSLVGFHVFDRIVLVMRIDAHIPLPRVHSGMLAIHHQPKMWIDATNDTWETIPTYVALHEL